MNSVLLPTTYLPPISWLAVVMQSKRVEIEIHETYPKQTLRNRCYIATSSGILSLTVPVIRINGNHTRTFEIGIDNSVKWQLLHWRSILTAYNNAPYFLYYRDHFEPIFTKRYENLLTLNRDILNILITNILKKKITILYTDIYSYKPDCIDLRSEFRPARKTDQILKYEMQRYLQVFEANQGFIPDLCILDLIFNLGPEALQYLADVKISVTGQLKEAKDIQF